MKTNSIVNVLIGILLALGVLFAALFLAFLIIGAIQAQPAHPLCSLLPIVGGPGEYSYPGPASVNSIPECFIEGPTSTPIDWPPPTATQQATSTPLPPLIICHMPGPNQETIWIDPPAWDAHAKHNDEGGYDYIGACVDWYPGATPWPPPTPLPTSTPVDPPK